MYATDSFANLAPFGLGIELAGRESANWEMRMQLSKLSEYIHLHLEKRELSHVFFWIKFFWVVEYHIRKFRLYMLIALLRYQMEMWSVQTKSLLVRYSGDLSYIFGLNALPFSHQIKFCFFLFRWHVLLMMEYQTLTCKSPIRVGLSEQRGIYLSFLQNTFIWVLVIRVIFVVVPRNETMPVSILSLCKLADLLWMGRK